MKRRKGEKKKRRVSNSELYFRSRQNARRIKLRLFRKILLAALKDLGIDQFELGIHIVGEAEMTQLNEVFLRHKGSTDVITFDYAENLSQRRKAAKTKQNAGILCAFAPLREIKMFGEVFVCIDEAVAQAKLFRTSWQSELVRYAIHGVLHLLGHDDTCAAARRKMKREEDRILRGLAAQLDLKKIDPKKKQGAT